MTETPEPPGEVISLDDFKRHDARRAGQDGYYWPRQRREMRSAVCIRERMVDDMREVLRGAGTGRVIVADDLVRLGWTAMQVHSHMERATDDLNISLRARPIPHRAGQPGEVA